MHQSTLARARRRGLTLRASTREQHLRFVECESARQHVSFLQCPSWADVKTGWHARFLAFFDGHVQVGGALVLCRRVRHSVRFFAYVPEGPVLDWSRPDVPQQLGMLVDELGSAGAFAVRIGPPLEYRSWSSSTLKQARGPGRDVSHIAPDTVDPLATAIAGGLGGDAWSRRDGARGAHAQPRYVFTVPLAGRNTDDVWDALSQGWRRNIRRARRADIGVGEGGFGDVPEFYSMVRQTELRQRFELGRSQAYFEHQFSALNDEAPDRMRLYLAAHGETLMAAHNLVTLGHRAWYLAGGSATAERDNGSSHLLQWQMICDSLARGVTTYDMRGVPTTLDPAQPSFGLFQWKLGTGGTLVETLGEWEIGTAGVTSRALHFAFDKYLARR